MNMNDCYKNVFALVILMLLGSFSSLAQGSISGKVIAEDTGEPLPGVTILEKGTTNGSVTNLDGAFTISVGQEAVLVFSFVGYLQQEIAVGSRTQIDVTMPLDVETLSEVVVIGYGQVQKEDLTGAVTAVEPGEFNRGAIVNAQDLLAGRVAGMQITSAGGAPGASSRIRIRGGSSINASNEPLVVIDGMPVANDELAGTRNPMSIVNPNDIASVSVLKDASATAIYGSRASNGVIIITTKRGSKEKLSFSYNGNVAIHTVPKTMDVFSGDELRALVGERVTAGDAQAMIAQDSLGTANTNWQDEVYSTAIGMDHNISASGLIPGVDIPARVSVGYTDQNGIIDPTRFQRTSLSVGLDPSFLDDHLKLNLNFKGAWTENAFTDEGRIIGGAVNFDPTQDIMRNGDFFQWDGASNQGPANPLAAQKWIDNSATVSRYLMNATVDYKLHFFPDVSAKLNLALDKSSTEGLETVDPRALWESTSQNGLGKWSQYEQEKENELLEATLNYTKNFPGNGGRLNVLAGYSWQHFHRYKRDSLNNLEENSTYSVPANITSSENFLVSFFGRIDYRFMDRYNLTFTLRRDGSSRFAETNRWGLFPAAAFAWNINEEAFLASSETLSNLKLRVGWGITGQQETVGYRDYPALARVTFANQAARYQFGNEFVTPIRYEAYDANLKWEETTTINIGLDYGFLNDRIYGSIDVYQRETVDALSDIPVPLGTNFSNRILTNIGDVENKGIEASINAFVIDNNDMSWEVGVNATHNQNKITKLTAVDDPNFIGILVGGISGGVGSTAQVRRVGSPNDSFFLYEQIYDSEGNPVEGLFVDQNQDGVINDLDRVVRENPNPDVFLGFSSRFSYKAFDFSFNARANIGNYVYNNVASSSGTWDNLYQSQGYVNNVGRDVANTDFQTYHYLSDYYLFNASFFRMDNISVGYRVDFTDDINAYFSFTVQNAFIITDYPGLDPEVQSSKPPGSEDEFAGIDNNLYPRPRSFVLGVNINF